MMLWGGVLIAYTGVASFMSYLVAAMNFPLVDSHFASADQALGFDWIAMLGWVVDNPWTWPLTQFFYQITMLLVVLTLLYLTLSGRLKETERYVTTVMVSGTIIVLLSGPLAGSGPYYHFAEARFLTGSYVASVLQEGTIHGWANDFFNLRDGNLKHFSLTDAKGLIVFPSFHAALAVAMIIAMRGTGWAFVLALFLNVGTLIVTPVEGGHYVVDVFAGAAVASAAWAFAGRLQSAVEDARPLLPRLFFGSNLTRPSPVLPSLSGANITLARARPD
jgi:membrane-associated phospholipid phosphatase